MSILPIYLYGQPILRKRARAVRTMTPGLLSKVEDMFATMRNSQGIGLAANQVGLLQRIIVIDISGMEEGEDVPPMVLINPEVISSEGSWVMEEGCLSIPEIRGEVKRPETVEVRFTDIDASEQEIEASGLLARVLQHEIDHLNGVLFIDYLDPAEQKTLKGRLNKISKGETEVAYPVSAVTNTVPAVR